MGLLALGRLRLQGDLRPQELRLPAACDLALRRWLRAHRALAQAVVGLPSAALRSAYARPMLGLDQDRQSSSVGGIPASTGAARSEGWDVHGRTQRRSHQVVLSLSSV